MNNWPHKGWHHADKKLSERATRLLGRQCYVCPGYLSETGEDAYMIADGIHTPVCISTLDELKAGVAELKSGINDRCSVEPLVFPHLVLAWAWACAAARGDLSQWR